MQGLEKEAAEEMKALSFRKSIYYNANPNHPNRIDLLEIMPNMDDNVVQQLLNYEGFQLELFASTTQISKFTHLYYRQKQSQQLFGEQELAIGFPFFFEQKETPALAQFAAPLFLFPVHLEHSKSRVDAWYLKAFENRSPIPNYALLDLFEKGGYPAQLSGLIHTFLEYGEFSYQAFKSLLIDLEILLKADHENTDRVFLKTFPNRIENQEQTKRFDFGKHLVLGHFPSNEISFLKDSSPTPLSDTNISDNKYDFFPMVSDPDQDFALRHCLKSNSSAIQGLKGTGKTYLSANLALHALLNGKKVIYINPRKSGREEFAQHLYSSGMGQKVLEWTNPFDFAHQTVSMLRAVQGITTKAPKINTNLFDTHFKEYERLRALDDDQHRLLHEPLIEGMTWNDMIGQHLQYKREAEQDDISGFVDGSEYEYSIEEYERLQATVADGQKYYAEILDSDSILYNTHANNYIPFEMDRAAQSMLKDKLVYFQYELQKLIQACLNTEKHYNQSVQNVLLQSYKQLKKRLGELKQQVQSAENVHGDALWNSSTFLSSLSKSKKTIKKLRNQLTESVKKLYTGFVACEDFEEIPAFDDFNDYKSIPTKIKTLNDALETWHSSIPKIVHRKSAALSKTTNFPKANDQTAHLAFYQSVNEFIQEVNEAEVFITLPFEQKDNTQQLSKQLEAFYQYCKKMEQVVTQEFVAFFPWRKLWFQSEQKDQLVLQSLIDSRSTHWVASFSKWYLEQRMSSEAPIVPLEDEHQQLLEEHVQYLHTHYKNLIANLWQDKRQTALKKLKKANKKCSDFIFKKKKRVTQNDIIQLEEYFSSQVSTLLDIFPIMICSPDFAAQRLVDQNALSDYFILDDAHCLPKRLTKRFKALGKQQTVLKDVLSNGVEDQENVENVLQFQLNYVHQSSVATALIEKHHLAKGDFMPNNIKHHWQSVEGQFEEEYGTNPIEVQSILQYLYEMEDRDLKSYKLAIVCATDAQKNLLLDKLLLIKTKRAIGSSRIQQLEVNNALSVHTLETLPFLKADIVLFSTTFTHPEQVRTKVGLPTLKSFLYDLTTLADIQTIFFHSFKQTFENIGDYSLQLSRLWLLESEALQLKSISETKEDGNFLYETYNYLQAYFDKGRLSISHEFSTIAPKSILVASSHPEQQRFLILFDRIASQHPSQSSRWENKIIAGMQQQGVEIVHTNSYEWWISSEEEARNVAIPIISSDKAFSTVKIKEPIEDVDSKILTKEEEIKAMLEEE